MAADRGAEDAVPGPRRPEVRGAEDNPHPPGRRGRGAWGRQLTTKRKTFQAQEPSLTTLVEKEKDKGT